MNKILFQFAPSTILSYLENTFIDAMENEDDALEVHATALSKAAKYEVKYNALIDGEPQEVKFADGLMFPIWAKATASDFEYGSFIEESPAALAVVMQKARRLAYEILRRFAPTYAKARTAFNSMNYDEQGGVETSTTVAGTAANKDLYRGGVASVTSTPTGETKNEHESASEGVTRSFGGFSGVLANVGEFIDGAIIEPKTAICDALFDALFVPFEQSGDFLVFGDYKLNMWE